MAGKRENKKHKVIVELYEQCKAEQNFVFDNNRVKAVSAKHKFGNPFDVTKNDNKDKLPKLLLEEDFALVHLGSGKHCFIRGVNKVYHDFEPIGPEISWPYRKSLLNQYNSSESNLLSIANNQRILHHFLFGKDTEFDDVDIMKRPKTYFPHRTNTSLQYTMDDVSFKLERIQLEVDLTIEYDGVVGVFEAKNGAPDSFAIYQLYHPFLYYHNANQSGAIRGKIKEVYGVYVVRTHDKCSNSDLIKLWAYTFDEPTNMCSIRLVKSAAYRLVHENVLL